MKNTSVAMGLLTFFGLTSCNQKKSTDGQTNGALLVDKEIFSLYRKTENVIYGARALTRDNESFDLHLYEINMSAPEGAKQTFTSVVSLTGQQLENKKSELKDEYNWTPFKDKGVLFVQIQPTGFKDEMQLLDKRQEIEDKLSEELEDRKLGEWFASDLGPGGGNILYTVSDMDKSLQIILEILQQNDLDKNVVIGRRVMLEKDDWFYDVIYPTKYSGYFNTM